MKRIQGSAHIVVIIILVAGLLAALGFVFYQNFLLNKASTDNNASSTTKTTAKKTTKPSVSLTKIEMNKVFSPGITFSYPSDWSINHSVRGAQPAQENEMTSETYILSDPSKTVDVSIGLYINWGIGGTCNANEAKNLDVFDTTATTNLGNHSYMQYIYQNQYQASQWIVDQAIADTSLVSDTHAGSSSCNVGFLALTTLPSVTSVSDGAATLRTGISQHGVDDMVGFSSLDEAKLYLTSDTAKSVKAILLSIQY